MSRQGAVTRTAPGTRQGRLLRALGAGASGLLLWAAFPPLDIGLIAWVGLVPLLWSLRGASIGTAFRLGYLAGVVWFGLVLSWAVLFGLPTWALLTAILALYVGAFAALLTWMAARRPAWEFALIPLLWVAVEFARSTGPLGFPWALLGTSQHRLLPVLQIASLGGVHLVSLLVVLSNALLLALFTRPRRTALIASGGVLFLASVGFGFWRMQTPLLPAIRVAALQPNIPPLQKGSPQTRESQIAAMRTLTIRARAAGADIIVFPETAIPVNLLGPQGLASEVGGWAADRVIVASSLETDRESGGRRNSAVVVHGDRLLGVYAKRRLVPFGEVWTTPGTRLDPIPTPRATVGIAICYESSFAEIGRAAAQRGSDLLLVLTNDGWFGPGTAGPAQHAAFAAVRAVETGRSLVRAANTGISMAVDPYGRVQRRLPLGDHGAIVAEAAAPVQTLYIRGGWLLMPALLTGVVLLALAPAAEALPKWRREADFTRLLATMAGPGILAFLGAHLESAIPLVTRWVIPPAMLLTAALVSGGQQALAIRPRRAPLSALLGLGVVAALGATMAVEYAHYLGVTLRLDVPPGGWLIGGLALLLTALAWEAWLHGAVFTAARAWRGNVVALILSTLPALVLSWGSTPEVLIWSLFVGAIFGAIRLLTGDALGLVLPRVAGMILLGALPALRA